jgi:uncharacterized protein (TIGR02118 family)
MIKLVYVITRRADVSKADFYEHWLKSHGPLVARQAGPLRLRKYVQSHLVDHPANEAMRAVRGMLPPVDGITEVWWDSFADLEAAYATEQGAASGQVLSQDEARFIDFSKSQVFLTEEHVIFDHTGGKPLGPEALKVTYLLARKNGLSQKDCHRTWLADHGPLVGSFSGVLHMKKYVQSHTIAPEWNARVLAAGFAAPLDGITEVWVGSDADLGRGGETEAGRNASMALVEDERRFVEMGASRCFLTREHLIFDHTAG